MFISIYLFLLIVILLHYVIFIFINFCLLLSFIIYFIYSLISLYKTQINFLREIICEKMSAIFHILWHFPLLRTINFHQSVTSFFILRIDLDPHVNNVLDMHILYCWGKACGKLCAFNLWNWFVFSPNAISVISIISIVMRVHYATVFLIAADYMQQ